MGRTPGCLADPRWLSVDRLAPPGAGAPPAAARPRPACRPRALGGAASVRRLASPAIGLNAGILALCPEPARHPGTAYAGSQADRPHAGIHLHALGAGPGRRRGIRPGGGGGIVGSGARGLVRQSDEGPGAEIAGDGRPLGQWRLSCPIKALTGWEWAATSVTASVPRRTGKY